MCKYISYTFALLGLAYNLGLSRYFFVAALRVTYKYIYYFGQKTFFYIPTINDIYWAYKVGL